MSPIASAAPIAPVNAPTLASGLSAGNTAQTGDSGSFGSTLAVVDKLPARKGAGQRAQNAGPAVPPGGKSVPQAPAATPVVTAAAVITAAIPPGMLSTLQPPGVNGLTPPGTATLNPALAGALPVGMKEAASGAPLAGHAAITAQDAAGAPDDAAGAKATDSTQAQAAADVASTDAALNDAAATAALASAAAAANAALSGDAAAADADRIATPSATISAAPAKGATPAVASLSDASGQAAATAQVRPATAVMTAAPVIQVLDRQGHNDGEKSSGDLSLNAAASAAAGEASVREVSAAQNSSLAGSLAPADPSVGSAQFPDQIAAHVSYLVDQNLNGATLQVNPPQLGPIEMRISVDAGHAQVWLSAHSAVTVDALQQSSSRLRDMLASQGFGQVSVDVSQRSFQDRSSHAQPYVWQGGEESAVQNSASVAVQSWPARAPSGVLDAYA